MHIMPVRPAGAKKLLRASSRRASLLARRAGPGDAILERRHQPELAPCGASAEQTRGSTWNNNHPPDDGPWGASRRRDGPASGSRSDSGGDQATAIRPEPKEYEVKIGTIVRVRGRESDFPKERQQPMDHKTLESAVHGMHERGSLVKRAHHQMGIP